MNHSSSDGMLARRAASRWTRAHMVFALGQLLTFFVSVILLTMYARGAVSFGVVHESVLFKIALMIGAIVTGALWEKDVFGAYWFAPEFMGEDTMTVIVVILHVGYLTMVFAHPENIAYQVSMLVIAYTVYIVNVAQYVIRTSQVSNQQRAAVRVRS